MRSCGTRRRPVGSRRRLLGRRVPDCIGNLPGGDRTNLHFRVRRQRLRARLCAVGLENECRQIEVGFIAESARIVGRHGGFDERDQLARGSIAPLADEIGACELRRFIAPAQIGHMADGAVGLINGASRRRLLRGVLRQSARNEY